MACCCSNLHFVQEQASITFHRAGAHVFHFIVQYFYYKFTMEESNHEDTQTDQSEDSVHSFSTAQAPPVVLQLTHASQITHFTHHEQSAAAAASEQLPPDQSVPADRGKGLSQINRDLDRDALRRPDLGQTSTRSRAPPPHRDTSNYGFQTHHSYSLHFSKVKSSSAPKGKTTITKAVERHITSHQASHLTQSLIT